MCHGASAQIDDPERADNSFCPAGLNRSRNLRYISGRFSSCGASNGQERCPEPRPLPHAAQAADRLADPFSSGNSCSSSGMNGA